MMNYNYVSEDRMVNISTLGPSGKYYYRIQPITALNKSAFGCKIAFFEVNTDRVLYHRECTYAFEINTREELDIEKDLLSENKRKYSIFGKSLAFVKWSLSGDIVYLIEFGNCNGQRVFDSLILDFEKCVCFRINEDENKFSVANSLHLNEDGFDDDVIRKELFMLRVKYCEFIKDDLQPSNILKRVFSKNKWYP